jgi:hypothetical protein
VREFIFSSLSRICSRPSYLPFTAFVLVPPLLTDDDDDDRSMSMSEFSDSFKFSSVSRIP